MNISEEAIEAAQKALNAAIDNHLPDAFDDGCKANDGVVCEDEDDCLWDMARIALEAATRHIAAQTLNEAADYIVSSVKAGADADLAPQEIIDWLRDRAELEARP